MWVFVNNHSSTKQSYNVESEILSYSFTDSDGIQHVKPMLRYYGGGGGNDQLIERNKYVFYFARYPQVNQYTSDEHQVNYIPLNKPEIDLTGSFKVNSKGSIGIKGGEIKADNIAITPASNIEAATLFISKSSLLITILCYIIGL